MVRSFNDRFEIQIDADEAQRRFLARIANALDEAFLEQHYSYDSQQDIARAIASELGDVFTVSYWDGLLGSDDFVKVLQGLEVLYDQATVPDPPSDERPRTVIDRAVREALAKAEVDLGVTWDRGRFHRKGAQVLDEKLVNDGLRWLRENRYETVVGPFEKALGHLLRSGSDPTLRPDVVTDAHEALEALAKIVTKRDRDLAANSEAFISKVKASDGYKVLLKDYIAYANTYRHAAEASRPKPELSAAEVESFVYLTGVFIRLAIS
jgi:hypothetical protein